VRHPRRSILIAVAVLVAVLAPAVLVACGGSGGGSSDDPAKILSDTFTGTKKLDSGKLDVAVDLTNTSKQKTSLRLTGPFQTNGAGKVPSFALTLSIAAAGQSLSAGFTSTGDAAYVTFGGKSYVLDDKTFKSFADGYTKAGKSGKKTSSSSPLSAFGVDPQRWLNGAKVVGSEEVGGTDTTHVTTGVNVAALVTDVNRLVGKASSATGQKTPQSLSPSEIAATAKTFENAHVDVFTGKDDKTLRRLVLAFDVAGGKPIAGMNLSSVRVSLGFADLNQPQTITAPKDPQPFSDLQTELQSFLGGVTTGSASGSGTGTDGSSGSSSGSSSGDATAGASKYLQCVQKAGDDIAKVQKCASLIGS
jgi:hypothetical protein